FFVIVCVSRRRLPLTHVAVTGPQPLQRLRQLDLPNPPPSLAAAASSLYPDLPFQELNKSDSQVEVESLL
ncbi:hypothetical protein CMV_019565, partial [Castanea mollissima]